MQLSLRKNGVDSLFKEVRVFKEWTFLKRPLFQMTPFSELEGLEVVRNNGSTIDYSVERERSAFCQMPLK